MTMTIEENRNKEDFFYEHEGGGIFFNKKGKKEKGKSEMEVGKPAGSESGEIYKEGGWGWCWNTNYDGTEIRSKILSRREGASIKMGGERERKACMDPERREMVKFMSNNIDYGDIWDSTKGYPGEGPEGAKRNNESKKRQQKQHKRDKAIWREYLRDGLI
jgi:hypothetical protein